MNHLRTSAVTTLAVFAVLVGAPSARGAFITGAITGQVTSAGASVPGIAVGSLLTGSYTYDSSTTFTGISGATNPLTAFSLTIGTNPHVFSLADLLTTGLGAAGVVPGFSTPTVNDLLFFFDSTAISSYVGAAVTQQVIFSPPQSFTVTSDPAHSFAFNFTAAAGTAVVPEPSTFTLLGLGCVAMGGFGWRARKRSLA